MGIRRPLDLFEKRIMKEVGMPYAGISWLELGNQTNRVRCRPAKEVYAGRGVEVHVSIDLNAKDGALPLDLDEPLPEHFDGVFDVVTNYGTAEHVNNQYQVFKTIHDSCRRGGLMIHGFPLQGTFLGHCRYYYPEEFVKKLAGYCMYNVVDTKIFNYSTGKRKRHLLAVAFIKPNDYQFIGRKLFNRLPIEDTKDTRRTGNYTK